MHIREVESIKKIVVGDLLVWPDHHVVIVADVTKARNELWEGDKDKIYVIQASGYYDKVINGETWKELEDRGGSYNIRRIRPEHGRP